MNSIHLTRAAEGGGNIDRPALRRLLDDVRAGKIDVIVVYKVDRSLADFANELSSVCRFDPGARNGFGEPRDWELKIEAIATSTGGRDRTPGTCTRG